MTSSTARAAERHHPAWGRAQQTPGDSRRPVNKRHRTAREGSGGRSRTMRRLASIPRPGVSHSTVALVEVPQGGGVRSSPTHGGRGAIGWKQEEMQRGPRGFR